MTERADESVWTGRNDLLSPGTVYVCMAISLAGKVWLGRPATGIAKGPENELHKNNPQTNLYDPVNVAAM